MNIASSATDGNAFLFDDQLITLEAGLDATNGLLVFPSHFQMCRCRAKEHDIHRALYHNFAHRLDWSLFLLVVGCAFPRGVAMGGILESQRAGMVWQINSAKTYVISIYS